ncbi:MAG: lamin tail domain-containing protein [Verrucomicrobiota bacterium]
MPVVPPLFRFWPLLSFLAGAAVSSASAQSVRLNEVVASNAGALRDGDGDSSDWIELHNPNPGAAADLSGMHLTDDRAVKNKWTFPAGASIPAGGYLVVFASSKNRAAAGAEPHTNFSLGGNGEYLALAAADGASVVSAFAPRFPAQTADLSWGRTAAGGFGFFPVPTPGAANGDSIPANHVIINELHVDPVDSKSKLVEFIELFNPLPAEADLSGWRFVKGVDFTFPPGTKIAPGGYLVIGEKPADLQTYLSFPGALGPWSGGLSNDGEEITLADAAGVTVDSLTYGLGTPWPVVGDEVTGSPAAPTGNSIQVINASADRTLGGSWRAAKPTPGAANAAVAQEIPPPAIRQVTAVPTSPVTIPTAVITSGQPVIITAKVTDPRGLASVVLEYQDVAPGSYIRATDPAFAAPWTGMMMYDDGVLGDAAADDDVFSVKLPASLQVHRHLIRYRIRATSQAGTAVTVPTADDPSKNFAYFCYDGVPAWTGAVKPGTTTASTFAADTMRKVRPWHLLSNATDVQNCQYNESFNDGTYRFRGTLVIDGRVYDHVKYRVKGQNSTYVVGKNKWKFKFNRGRLLELPDDYGLDTTTADTVNISSLAEPWAAWNRGLAGLDEAVAFKLSNLADSPAPNSSYVQWRVIDAADESPSNQYNGDLWGLYLAFENQDNHFKDAHGLPDGNIFRMQATGEGNHILGQGTGQPSNLSDLNAFLSASTGYKKGGGSSTTAPLVTAIQPVTWFRSNVHLPRYFTWRSVMEAVNQTDKRDQENVVYFRNPGPADRRWEIYPWDCDLLYEQVDRWGPQAVQTPNDFQAYEQIGRLLLHPELRIEFQNHVRGLQDLLLNSDQAWKVVDEFVSFLSPEAPRVIPIDGTIPLNFAEVDRRVWENNPRNTAVRAFYRTPWAITPGNNNGPYPARVLKTADFAGTVRWVKEFIATDAHGGGRLSKMAQGSTNPYTLKATDPASVIPATPVITYTGPAGFPANGLSFSSSAFSSPNTQSFAAIEWRIGEIYDPSVSGFTAGTPWRYEITPVWQSGELTAFNAAASPPATGLSAGRTYRARVRHKDAAGHWSHWSAPAEFTAGASSTGNLATDLVISEIMYNPPDTDGQDLEFIELMNTGTAPLDLTGVQFTAGILWSFPDGTTIAPGARLLVVKNRAAFEAKYGPGLPIAGEYLNSSSNGLSNSGETLSLSLGASQVLRSLSYGTDPPWPAAADGDGSSLTLTAPAGNPDPGLPASWQAAPPTPGTVAAAGSGFAAWKTLHGITDNNEDRDGDGLNALLEYATASDPAVPSRATLPVFTRLLDGRFSAAITVPAGAGVEAVVETSADFTTWSPAAATSANPVREGGKDLLQLTLPPPPGAKLFLRVRFSVP